jgi:hypothetical protein
MAGWWLTSHANGESALRRAEHKLDACAGQDRTEMDRECVCGNWIPFS